MLNPLVKIDFNKKCKHLIKNTNIYCNKDTKSQTDFIFMNLSAILTPTLIKSYGIFV